MNQPRITRMQPGLGDSRPCLDPGSIRVPSVAENHPLVELQTSPSNPLPPAIAPDAPGAASGVLPLSVGPNELGQPFQALARLAITQAQAAKLGLEASWHAAHRRQQARLEKKTAAVAALAGAVARLQAHAESQEWSQRKLAARVGLSWGGWLRCRAGVVSPRAWLPRLAAAMRILGEGEGA